MTHASVNTRQVGYRGRSGDTVGLNDNTTWVAAQNTDWTQDIDAQSVIRLRMEVEENGGASTTIAGSLYYSLNGGAFTQVTTSSSVVRAIASAQFNEGDATTDVLTAGAGTFVAGTGSEDGEGGSVTLLSQHTEWEFCLQFQAGDLVNGDTVAFHIRPSGSDLNSYVVTPTVTIKEAIVGTGAISVPAATVSGTGKLTLTATGAISVPAPTVAGTGKEVFTATGAIVGQAPTISGTGKEVFTATGAIVGQPPTVVGSGTHTEGAPPPPVGTGAISVPAATVSGSGFLILTGTGAISIPAPLVAGVGAEVFAGTGSIIGQAPTVAGAGITFVPVTGTGAISVPAPTVAGTGTSGGATTGGLPPEAIAMALVPSASGQHFTPHAAASHPKPER